MRRTYQSNQEKETTIRRELDLIVDEIERNDIKVKYEYYLTPNIIRILSILCNRL